MNNKVKSGSIVGNNSSLKRFNNGSSSNHIETTAKEAYHCLYLLRRLRGKVPTQNVTNQDLQKCYCLTPVVIQAFCIYLRKFSMTPMTLTDAPENASYQDASQLYLETSQTKPTENCRVMFAGQSATQISFLPIKSIYTLCCPRNAANIIKDYKHPSHSLFSLSLG